VIAIPNNANGTKQFWGAAGTTNCVWVVFHTRTRKRDGATIIERLCAVWLLYSEAVAHAEREGRDAEIYGIPFYGAGAAALEAGLRATWPPGLVKALEQQPGGADLGLEGETWEAGLHL
jgi:hypothetical protein